MKRKRLAKSGRKKFHSSLRTATIMAISFKILVFSLGFAAVYVLDGPSSPLSMIINQFVRWDAPHYFEIARNWYVNTGDQANFIVFFPLYPLIIRILAFDSSYVNVSALIVSNVSSIIAFIYLFKLARLEFDKGIATKAVLFLSIFPTAYFLSAPYTESLFLALAIGSMYYARKAKWPLTGLLAMLASLTRLTGLVLFPALLIEYMHQKKWKLKNIDSSIFWSGLVLVGLLIYLFINFQTTGNPFAFIEIQREHWFNTLDPIAGLRGALSWAENAGFPGNITIGAAPMIFALFGLCIIIAGFKYRLRPSYNMYMLLTWLIAISTSWWISVPRYIMAMFPMFIMLATLRNKAISIATMVVFLAGLCFFTILFATGQWAF
jgi:Gpi18-like mannosyltransferase